MHPNITTTSASSHTLDTERCLGAGSCAPAGTGAAGAEAGSDAAAGGVVYCPASPMSYRREIWTQSYASVDVSDAQDYGGDTTVAG